MPVVTSLASIVTVNAVCSCAVFSETISGRFNSDKRSAVAGKQIIPRPYFAIKLIASGVAFSAAMIKSPSFSRSGSSETIIISPFRIASMASGIVLNFIDAAFNSFMIEKLF